MLNYIQQALDVKCSRIDLPLEEMVLPLYFDIYKFSPVKLDNIQVLFITPRDIFPNVTSISRHIEKLQNATGCFIALLVSYISDIRRESLIKNHISFVVENNQIYLPFMGIYLQEKLKRERVGLNQFTPAAQLLFLFFFNQNQKELPTVGFATKFNLSEMTTTRALRQLEATGLFEIRKSTQKNSNLLVSKITGKKELFQKIEQYLINPVKKIFYVDKEELDRNKKLLVAGDSYLSLFSMLGEDKISCWVFYGKQSEFKTATTELVDTKKQVKVQLWKYDPNLLTPVSKNDPISVYLSFSDCTDERINKEKKELITKAIEDSNADSWS